MTEDKTFIDKAQEVAKDVAEKAKDVAVAAKEKVSSFVGDHEDQIHSGIDKTGEFVDDKTKGRFSEKIDKAQDAAKGAVSKLGGSDEDDDGEGGAEALPAADTTASAEPAETAEPAEPAESAESAAAEPAGSAESAEPAEPDTGASTNTDEAEDEAGPRS